MAPEVSSAVDRRYAAQEIFRGGDYNCNVDVWSLGIINLEILSQLPDYQETGEQWYNMLQTMRTTVLRPGKRGWDHLYDFTKAVCVNRSARSMDEGVFLSLPRGRGA